ncbi:esterase/lipase family protein [Clostridium cibarium]|uniref:triacylglycerol lipase n=1 Tax=Clostridium cibarium TaxID=2762247 RepID=A0ABR8PQR5_9CLOT|nr:lipase [Clostridium cibarium]MBD7910493.1 lipase [Clostridium cibarium]
MNKKIKKIAIYFLSIIFIIFAIPYNVLASTGSNNQSSNTAKVSTSNDIPNFNNNYPIVMVHGLCGWGNKEMFNENYWGGSSSLRELLISKGYTVFTPTIGPISSNWDRACELYAYLKGGTVDYGEAHSKKYGHARYGRTFPGVYPKFGEYSDKNELQKIHLIGHSMGGETSRMLAHLLEHGDKDEINATGNNTSTLFTGNKHWIDSITTIATPHDGSQEAEIQENFEPFVHQFFASVAASAGLDPSTSPNFDLRMDQWGLRKTPNESFDNYLKRVFQSNIWKNTKDLSIWDLSLEGAREFNNLVSAENDIYYFSIACSDTHKDPATKYQLPNINMHPLLIKSAIDMGVYTQNQPNKVKVDASWWENDGLVSVRSAIGPHEGSSDKIENYDVTPKIGVWNYLEKIDNIDHFEIMIQREPIYHYYLQNKFVTWAKMLSQLPK